MAAFTKVNTAANNYQSLRSVVSNDFALIWSKKSQKTVDQIATFSSSHTIPLPSDSVQPFPYSTPCNEKGERLSL